MIIDLVVLAVVLVSALISFMRGFIREVLTIAGVVCGIVAAVLFGPMFAPTVRGWFGVQEGSEGPPNLFGLIPMEFVADAVSYGALFLGVVIVVYIITHFISGAAKAVGLGPVDRTLGVVFGIARGLILLGLIYMPLNVLIPPQTKDNWFKESQTHIIIEKVSASMASYLPDYDAVKQEAKDADDQFKKKLEETDLLAGDKDKAKAGSTAPADAANKPDEEGYREDQRDKLDALFNEPVVNE